MHSSLSIKGTKGKTLKGKLIVLGVTGSVAVVKSFELCRELMRKGADVRIVMSEAAKELMGEKMMHYASGRKVISGISGQIEHVDFFGENGKADLMLIAPATANTISKIATGIDDTAVTTFATTAIGRGKPVIIVPAMHYTMYKHPIVGENLRKLGKRKVRLVGPLIEEGKAKISPIGDIVLEVERELSEGKMKGKKVLVANGPTEEEIDAVRVITNKSSGRLGEEIAREAYRQGAEVTVVGKGEGKWANVVWAKNSGEFERNVMRGLKGKDFFFCPAAISDFRVKKNAGKISSGGKHGIELVPRGKLIEKVRKKFPKIFIVGFKAETGKTKKQLEKIAEGFLKKDKLQVVVATNVEKSMGFSSGEFLLLKKGKKKWVRGEKEKIAGEIIRFLGLG